MKKRITGMIVALGLLPGTVTAQGLLPCKNDCHFSDLVILAQNIIDYLLFYIALPLAAISFAIAGFMMMFAKGNEARITQAKTIFWYVLWGLVIALAAWLVVQAILIGIGLKPEYWLLG